MSQRVKDKVAVVTAAGLGIGRACAVRFASEGAKVVVSDINPDNAAKTVEIITENGGEAVSMITDVTQADQVDALVSDAVAKFGRLDIMVNNAGGALPNQYLDASLEEYHKIMALNMHSVHYGLRAALPVMKEQGGGSIVSMSSGAGLGYCGGLSIYGGAKAGLAHLTRGVAVEYGKYGIRANVISPGPMDTPGLRTWLETLPNGYEKWSEHVPVGRLGLAEDIANAALFLCSDEASFVNGILMPVDGAVHAKLSEP
ncbi:SDR family oxidoreductase [Pseudomaricurvus alkylphenolicus]|uniref:SDR family NAD(P)-dependent oxidoreductase n=1 Tax=Pseudomaricurvus alkylphenolicus TaxID=1306991 RepID=UPI00141FD597|nr:SDR family oxidoreductase [Pseudomaricurvus alkylphenolicus]NIB37996.1 SDR family oxidoreductase [Pseudomaricurvus alkylphenolicus]